MAERDSYAPGTPCWIDLGTPDQDASGDFYGSLFGWKLQEDENTEQTGGYRVATLKDKAVGGVMRLMQEGQPTAWMTYICVEDADATVARAKEAGGEVIVEPMTVLDYGRMAIVKDPTGAVFGIWQPGVNIGAGLVNEPGAFAWSEINTRDPDAARSFYGDVFGWSFEDTEFEGAGTYTLVKNDGTSFGGLVDISGRVPEDVPPHWLVYFGTDDADGAAAKATEMGGSVAVGPEDIPTVGRFAVLQDQFGAAFAVIAPDPRMEGGD
jgi:predicted enzyme related to lactoylglutathione lyase